MILFLPLLLIQTATSQNLLCDSSIAWKYAWPSDPSVFNLDTAQCSTEITATLGQAGTRMSLMVDSIFSDAANYPITFTITGTAVGGEASFSPTFGTTSRGWWGISSKTSSTLTVTYQWDSITSTSYKFNGRTIGGTPPAGDINELGFRIYSKGTSFSITEVLMDPYPGTAAPAATQRDCSVLHIDSFLTECSAEFEGHGDDIQDLKDQIAGIEDKLANAGDDLQIQGQTLTAIVTNFQTDIDTLDQRVGLFAAQSIQSAMQIDSGSNGHSLFGTFKFADVLIMILLSVNLLAMGYIYCYQGHKMNQNKGRIAVKQYDPDDEENNE